MSEPTPRRRGRRNTKFETRQLLRPIPESRELVSTPVTVPERAATTPDNQPAAAPQPQKPLVPTKKCVKPAKQEMGDSPQQVARRCSQLTEWETRLKEMAAENQEQRKALEIKERVLHTQIVQEREVLREKEVELAEQNELLSEAKENVASRERLLEERSETLAEKETDLAARIETFERNEEQVERVLEKLNQEKEAFAAFQKTLADEHRQELKKAALRRDQCEEEYSRKKAMLDQFQQELNQRQTMLGRERQELRELRRDTLEIRLGTETRWLQLQKLNDSLEGDVAELDTIRQQLAEEYQKAKQELSLSWHQLEQERGEFAQRERICCEDRDVFLAWAAEQNARIDAWNCALLENDFDKIGKV